jgi:multiple sugar transport system permease protein
VKAAPRDGPTRADIPQGPQPARRRERPRGAIRRPQRAAAAVSAGALTLLGALFTVPFLWMISLSFDDAAAVSIPYPPSLVPRKLTVVNWQQALEKMNLARVMANSFEVEAGVLAVTLVTSLMAGYAVSKIRFRGHRVVLLILLMTLMIPLEVRLIPLFLLFRSIGMVNNYWSFFLTAAGNGYLIFLVKSYMDTLPDSLREAARVDGAGEWYVFSRIFVPLSGNIIASLIILEFLATWNNLLWPLVILATPSRYTVQVQLLNFRSIASNMGATPYPALTMAGNIVSIVPVLVVFLFLQRYIIQSVALSGLKQ